MNYKRFKRQLSSILETRDGFDPEWYQDWYIEFKESMYDDVKEFASFWFADVSFNTHSYQLKNRNGIVCASGSESVDAKKI